MNVVKRGWVDGDQTEFGDKWKSKMNSAAEEIQYLLNRGYETKSAAVFVGNHYMLSERQRLALARMLSAKDRVEERQKKKVEPGIRMDRVFLDGFNTMITLEVALSGSLLIEGKDGCIRDLAGLRGTYRIVDKTETAAGLLLDRLDEIADSAVIYLDQPVSNSGRLKALLCEKAEGRRCAVTVELLPDVDRTLYDLANVITTDAIILDHCKSWYNLVREIVEEKIPGAWIYRVGQE